MRSIYDGEYDFLIEDFDVLLSKSQIIIAIGGDGTILSTVRRLEKNIKLL